MGTCVTDEATLPDRHLARKLDYVTDPPSGEDHDDPEGARGEPGTSAGGWDDGVGIPVWDLAERLELEERHVDASGHQTDQLYLERGISM